MSTIQIEPTEALKQEGGRKYVDDEGFVVREGKLFECGNYPHMRFALRPEEADAEISRMGGRFEAANDFNHGPTVVTHDNDGRRRPQLPLGATTVTRRDGDALFGKVRIPEWLDKIVGDDELRVSTTWDLATKRLVGTALMLDPHIPDAAVFSAFKADPNFATFALAHPDEANLINEATQPPVQASPMPLTKEQIWADHSAKNPEAKREDFDALFATPAPADTSAIETDLAVFKKDQEAINAENARQLAEFANASLAIQAEAFANEQYRLGKCHKPGVEKIQAMFAKAAVADGQNGLATFSNGKLQEGASIQTLRDFFKDAPVHQHAEGEQIRNGDPSAVAEFGNNPLMRADYVAALPASVRPKENNN